LVVVTDHFNVVDFFKVVVLTLKPENRDEMKLREAFIQPLSKLERGYGLVEGVERPSKQPDLLTCDDSKRGVFVEKVDVRKCLDAAVEFSVLFCKDTNEGGPVPRLLGDLFDDLLKVRRLPEVSVIVLRDTLIGGNILDEELGEAANLCRYIAKLDHVGHWYARLPEEKLCEI
jgi:hypothetical protein